MIFLGEFTIRARNIFFCHVFFDAQNLVVVLFEPFTLWLGHADSPPSFSYPVRLRTGMRRTVAPSQKYLERRELTAHFHHGRTDNATFPYITGPEDFRHGWLPSVAGFVHHCFR